MTSTRMLTHGGSGVRGAAMRQQADGREDLVI